MQSIDDDDDDDINEPSTTSQLTTTHLAMVLSYNHDGSIWRSIYLYSGLDVTAYTALEHCAGPVVDCCVEGVRVDNLRFTGNSICKVNNAPRGSQY